MTLPSNHQIGEVVTLGDTKYEIIAVRFTAAKVFYDVLNLTDKEMYGETQIESGVELA